MERTVDLLRVEQLQLANKQYVVRSGATLGTVIKSYPNTKISDDINLKVVLPVDDSDALKNVNMLRINQPNGEHDYYDILNIDTQTFYNKSIIVTAIYDAVASILSSSSVLAGYYDRARIPLNLGAKLSPTDDALRIDSILQLGQISGLGGKFHIPFYVEITTKHDIVSEDNSTLGIYGSFIDFDIRYMSQPQYLTWYVGDESGSPLLTLRDLISSIDVFPGIPSDSIVNVSISRRCPWKYRIIKDDGNNVGYCLRYADDTDVPVLIHPTEPVATIRGVFPIHVSTANSVHIKESDEHSLERTFAITPMQRWCGEISIVDERGNTVGSIPTEYFDSNNRLRYKFYTISDYGMMYSIFEFADRQIIMPEGSLPWVGDAWLDYAIRSRDFDREEMRNAVASVYEQRNIDMINAVGSGMLTAAVGATTNPAGALLGVAQMGLGLVTSEMQADLAARNIHAAQNIREGRMKAAASVNYQTGYGLEYCQRSVSMGGARLEISVPANLTETEFNNFVQFYGYPAKKYASLQVQTGVIKANIYSMNNIIEKNGPKMDMLRKLLADGIRIVVS